MTIYFCKHPLYVSVLLEHLKNTPTLDTVYITNKTFRYIELLPVLFQIYFPLVNLSESFTHYDLHTGNVLLYKPNEDAYIEYKYYLPNSSIITIHSQYIAKITDYGFCFFNDSTNPNMSGSSKNIYKFVMANKDACKDQKSLRKILRRNRTKANKFIANRSVDVRLLYLLSKKKMAVPDPLQRMFNKIVFADGTKEIPNGYPTKIQTCSDVVQELLQIIGTGNAAPTNLAKLGTLHIYTDGRAMTFEKHNADKPPPPLLPPPPLFPPMFFNKKKESTTPVDDEPVV